MIMIIMMMMTLMLMMIMMMSVGRMRPTTASLSRFLSSFLARLLIRKHWICKHTFKLSQLHFRNIDMQTLEMHADVFNIWLVSISSHFTHKQPILWVYRCICASPEPGETDGSSFSNLLPLSDFFLSFFSLLLSWYLNQLSLNKVSQLFREWHPDP